jgi:hypothetical protein
MPVELINPMGLAFFAAINGVMNFTWEDTM